MDINLAKTLLQCSIDSYSTQTIVEGNDAVLIKQCDIGLVIAFRGTLPPTVSSFEQARLSITDWILNDGDVVLKSVPYSQGKVHCGFHNSLDRLWDQILTHIPQNFAIYITGHSKGGAMANLCALRLKSMGHNVVAIYTFGAPCSGDFNHAIKYNTIFDKHYRFVNQSDMVPHLPPSSLFFDVIKNVPLLPRVYSVFFPKYSQLGQLCFMGIYHQLHQPAIGSVDEIKTNRKIDELLIVSGDQLILDHFTKNYMKSLCSLISE